MRCICKTCPKMYVISETRKDNYTIKEYRCMECGRTVKLEEQC